MTRPDLEVIGEATKSLQRAEQLSGTSHHRALCLCGPLQQIGATHISDEEEIAGVTVLRGIEGYGSTKQIHTAKIEFLSLNLPVVIVAVDHKEKIEAVIPKVKEIVGTEGLMTVEKVEVVSPAPAVASVR